MWKPGALIVIGVLSWSGESLSERLRPDCDGALDRYAHHYLEPRPLRPEGSASELTYADFVRRMAELSRFPNTSMYSIGKSEGHLPEETNTWLRYRIGKRVIPRDIYCLDYHPLGATQQIVIVAGHHATEPAGPVAALDFFERLLTSESELSRKLLETTRVTVIPLVDVDRYALPFDQRIYSMTTNNFYDSIEPGKSPWEGPPGYSSAVRAGPEAVAVAAALRNWNRATPLLLALDLHEAAMKGSAHAHRGFFVIQDNEEDIAYAIRDRLRSRGLDTHLDWYWEEDDDSSNFSGFARRLGAHAITFESPRYQPDGEALRPAAERVEMHLQAIDEALRRVLDKD